MKQAKKYHINPTTGNPNQCTATVRGCAYAKDDMIPEHYDTKDDAKKAYEKQMDKEYAKAPRLKKQVKTKSTPEKRTKLAYPKPDVSSSKPLKKSREIRRRDPSGLQKIYRKLGKIAEVEVVSDGISFYNEDGDSVSFTFEGDCCSTAEVENTNVEPIDSPIKNITQSSGFTEDLDYGTVKHTNIWEIEYEDGQIQNFVDINYSNGYYGNMSIVLTTIPEEEENSN